MKFYNNTPSENRVEFTTHLFGRKYAQISSFVIDWLSLSYKISHFSCRINTAVALNCC